MSQEFLLAKNNDYVAIKGSYVGESLGITILNGSVFDGAKIEVFVGQLYDDEFDFENKVSKDETEITKETAFYYNAYTKDNVPLYGILKLTNATVNTSINILIGTSTKANIKSFIQ